MRPPEGNWAKQIERFDGIKLRRGPTPPGELSGAATLMLRLMDPFGEVWPIRWRRSMLKDLFDRLYRNRWYGEGRAFVADGRPEYWEPKPGALSIHRARPSDSSAWNLQTNGLAELVRKGAATRGTSREGEPYWCVTPQSKKWTSRWREEWEQMRRQLPAEIARVEQEEVPGPWKLGGTTLFDARSVFPALGRAVIEIADEIEEILEGIRADELAVSLSRKAWLASEAASRVWAAERERAFLEDRDRILRAPPRARRRTPSSARPAKGRTVESLMLELDAISAEILSRAPTLKK